MGVETFANDRYLDIVTERFGRLSRRAFRSYAAAITLAESTACPNVHVSTSVVHPRCQRIVLFRIVPPIV